MAKFAIIGAGISGLTAGYLLQKDGHDVVIFEQNDYVGGVMRSHKEDGYLVESGPNTILEKEQFGSFIEELGLSESKIYPDNCAKIRYVVRHNKLTALPMSPPSFLKSNLFPFRAKFRLLCEPLIPRKKSNREESIAQFVKRRLGKEILDYAINPFVAGTYAGKPEDLSIKHAFPKLQMFEDQHGSLIKAQIHAKKQGKKHPQIISFRNGLSEFPQAMYAKIGKENVHLNTKVQNIHLQEKGAFLDFTSGKIKVDKIIFAGTVPSLCKLKINNKQLPFSLQEVYYPPIAVLCLGLHKSQVSHSLNGFGFLVPHREKANILGSLFSSSLFVNRAPKEHILLTVFMGGARQPYLAQLEKQQMIQLALEDLKRYLGVVGKPTFVYTTKWEKSIPQYTVGYGKYKKIYSQIEKKYPNLHLIGNYRDGVSITDTVKYAQKIVGSVMTLPRKL